MHAADAISRPGRARILISTCRATTSYELTIASRMEFSDERQTEQRRYCYRLWIDC